MAVRYRRALELLGWPLPKCLPGERYACGGDDAEHVASYLGAVQALADFKLEHLHLGERGAWLAHQAFGQVHDELAAIEAARPCGREH
ncbi:MAG TPA: hypothetical protein VGR98_21030 [Streptosporangiaceae bacterium]|nr:hypothetical protein [Streptosporangiaceae bacterium]